MLTPGVVKIPPILPYPVKIEVLTASNDDKASYSSVVSSSWETESDKENKQPPERALLTDAINDLNERSIQTTTIPTGLEGPERSIYRSIGRIRYALQIPNLARDKSLEAARCFILQSNESLTFQWSREIASKEHAELNKLIDTIEFCSEMIAGKDAYEVRLTLAY
jgi:hypothetical protein